MLFDRQPRRILWGRVVVVCLVAATAGCHSTMLQPLAPTEAAKTPPSTVHETSRASSPSAEGGNADRIPLAPQVTPAAASQASSSLPLVSSNSAPAALKPALDLPRIDLDPPVTGAVSSPPSIDRPTGLIDLEKAPAPSPITATVYPPAPRPARPVAAANTPPPSATPMIDAALRSAERMEKATLLDVAGGDAAPTPKSGKAAGGVTSNQPAVVKVAMAAKPAASPEPPKAPPESVSAPVTIATNPLPAPLETPPIPQPKQDSGLQKASLAPKAPPVEPSARPTEAVRKPATESAEPKTRLAITDARFCRKVLSFGSVEPLQDGQMKPGQRVDLYAELAGVKFEKLEDGFRSKISSKLELCRVVDQVDAQAFETLWEETIPTVEDVCRHRRQDFFLNYRLPLPESATPGDYVLRLTVTDLNSRQSATSEIPVKMPR